MRLDYILYEVLTFTLRLLPGTNFLEHSIKTILQDEHATRMPSGSRFQFSHSLPARPVQSKLKFFSL